MEINEAGNGSCKKISLLLMKKNSLLILFGLTLLIIACAPDIKVYKVNYKNNYPQGTFKTMIGNETVFSNGPDILEVTVKKNPEFFCYSVNKQALCNLNLEIKIGDNAAGNFKNTVDKYQEIMQKSGKNKTILPQRISYYLNNQKLEQEDIIKANEKVQASSQFLIPILGKGNTQDEAKKKAVDTESEVFKVLIDKK